MKMYVVGDWVKVTERSFMPFRGKWVKIVEINDHFPTMPVCKIEYNGEQHNLPIGDVIGHVHGEPYTTTYSYGTISNQSSTTAIKSDVYYRSPAWGTYIKQLTELCNQPKKEENNMPIFPGIKNVYFNDPVTVVIWADKSKTIVRCSENDLYDPEKGLAMAIIKKLMGNDNYYHKIFKKWVPETEPADSDAWKEFERAFKCMFSFNTVTEKKETE